MDKAMSFFLIKRMFVNRYSKKHEVKDEIRAIADNYEEFNDMVFELGCRTLADEYLRGGEKRKMKRKIKDGAVAVVGSASVVMMIFGILFMSRIPEMAVFLLAGAVLGIFDCVMEWKYEREKDEP